MVNWNRFRRQHSLSLYDKPARERHLVSLTCSILSVITLIIALILPQWAFARIAGRCDCEFGLTKVFCLNPKKTQSTICETLQMTSYYTTSQEILISCILSITVLTMMSSILAVIISAGYPREKLEFLRHYSVFNIVSLLCIVLVAGFWLAVAETLPVGSFPAYDVNELRDTVEFGYGYYIYLAAGVFSLVAACLNLLRARTAAERRRNLRHRLRQNVWNQQRQRAALGAPTATTSSLLTHQEPIFRDPLDLRYAVPPTSPQQPSEQPPEYTPEATTEFMEDFSELENSESTSDSSPLVPPPPPPYAP